MGKPEQRTVLYIDDEASNLMLRKLLLESSGYRALTAPNGPEGLKLFESVPVDAVIVDYSMPDMDGAIVSARIRASRPRIPIIMLSGFSGVRPDAEHVVDAFINKADNPNRLLQRLRSLIGVRDHAHPELESEYVVQVDDAMQYVDCSDAVCRLTGYSRSEMLDKKISDLSYKPGIVPNCWQQFRTDGEMSGEYVIKHKSGRPMLIRFTAWIFPDHCTAAVWEPVTNWRELYRRAMLEIDPPRLKQYVELAVIAIHERIRELDRGPESIEERHELSDALSGIRILQKE